MRAIAELIMRGRMQATLVVASCAFLPVFFWISAAAGSLVLLRRGAKDAFGVLVWALLPLGIWWHLGSPNVPLAVVGTLVLAQVLRSTGSWTWVLLSSVVLGIAFIEVLNGVFPEFIAELTKLFGEFAAWGAANAQKGAELPAGFEASILGAVPGMAGSSLQLMCLLCLMLARYWQAALYNKGGFGLEFRALRLQPIAAIALLLGIFLAASPKVQLVQLAPIFTVPLLLAGIALGHGLVKIRRMSAGWLVLLYVAVVAFGNLICLLAVLDSLFDFRGRLARNGAAKDDSANGEG